MSEARAEIPFRNQQLMIDEKTVEIEITNDILIANGDKLEITFNTTVGPFVTKIVRTLDIPDSDKPWLSEI